MIKRIAEYFSLNIWDWMAVSVAFCSLCVAVLSLVIAKRTLRSQQQTERNTMPIINIHIQEFLLGEFVLKLLDGQTRICALWHLLYAKGFQFYPSEQILEKICIATDTLHTELFYGIPDFYHSLQGLLNMTQEYNINLATLNRHLSNPQIDNDLLNQEFDNVQKQNQKIARTWRKVMHIVYGYDADKTAAIFRDSLERADGLAPAKQEYFSAEDEAYVEFFEAEADKAQLLRFMNARAEELMGVYEHFLIKR